MPGIPGRLVVLYNTMCRAKEKNKKKIGQPPSDALGTGNSKGQLLLNMFA